MLVLSVPAASSMGLGVAGGSGTVLWEEEEYDSVGRRAGNSLLGRVGQ
jgi:hypothetical protein